MILEPPYMKNNQHISFLWKDPEKKESYTWQEHDQEDMLITKLQEDFMAECQLDIEEFIKTIPIQKDDILFRQKVMYDFIQNRELFDRLMPIGQDAYHQMTLSKFSFEREATVYNLINRMNDVERVRNMTERAIQAFDGCKLKSEGLIKYREMLNDLKNARVYEAFMEDVKIIKAYEDVRSIKIGLNLDEYLQPVEAILLDISEDEFKYTRLDKKMDYYISKGVKEILLIPRKIFARESIAMPEALNMLEKVVEPALLQLIAFCDQFVESILEVLSLLKLELPYYKIGVSIYEKLSQKGFPMTLPEFTTDDSVMDIQDMYHLNLALSSSKEDVISNCVYMNSEEKVFILTGANRGGKTTTTQSLIHMCWFGQLGFYVPAKSCKMPVYDEILLHFPKEESETVHYGRLGEECNRFKGMYETASNNSIFFMNESFSGTSHQESLQISSEVIRGIFHKGARVIFNTHLHELLDNLEAYMPKEVIVSYIAGRDMKKSPYTIEKGRPLGKSYGIEVARQYGMSYEQLTTSF